MQTPAARLEVVAGNATGMSILVDDELIIGRQAPGAGKLAEDHELSRSHARISWDASGFCGIEDLGSTNGTFVNGLRISGPQTLAEGDSIEVGATTLVVRELPSPAPKDAEPYDSPPQPTVIPGVQPAPFPAEPPAESAAVLPEQPRAEVPPPAEVPEEPPAEVPEEPTAEVPAAEAPAGAASEVPGGAVFAELPHALTLRVEVDFATRDVRILLDDASEPLGLWFEGGAWRATHSSEKS